MKLLKVSFLFSLTITTTLLVTLFFLWEAYKTHKIEIIAQETRQNSIQTVNYFQINQLELKQLVKAYIATADPRYLIYYYDLLAMINGEKSEPHNYNASSYWFLVLSGKIKHEMPKKRGVSIAERMRGEGFSKEELAQLDALLLISEKIKKIDQIAFAATQGMYDVEEKKFVDDSAPNLEYAAELVYGKEYINLNIQFYTAIETLIDMTHTRTKLLVDTTESQLQKWLLLSLIFMVATIITIIASFVAVRQFFLLPITLLTDATQKIAHGNYTFQLKPKRWFYELHQLASTFNIMASDISRDIQNREKNRLELEKAKEIAEDATKTKAMFLANMSHEIRTPMNAIIGMAYLALETDLTPKQREFIEQVSIAGKSLLGIINDILDFSKIEAGKMQIESHPFELKSLLSELINMQSYQVKGKNIELIFESDDAILAESAPYLLGDKLRVSQIVNNLLSNAIKFTHAGFVKLSVHSQKNLDESVNVIISVEDTGIGMSEEQLSRLFQEFTQMDDSTSRKYGGTGLGLAISKNLADAMGGDLRATSRVSKGSRFELEISFTTIIVEKSRVENQVAKVIDERALEGVRLLLVEDNLMNQKLALELLNNRGVSIVIANNGQEALDKLFSHRVDYFDMVLMDVQMPVMNGYEATLKIREKRIYDKLPIIALTASVLHEELEQCMRIGMQEHISKPIDPQRLFEIVAKYSNKILLVDKQEALSEELSCEIKIDGLNTKIGLKHSANNIQLYKEMLHDFALKYANFISTFEVLLQENNLNEAERYAHTLKGILGTIGANDLYQKAALVEKSSQSGENITAIVADLEDELKVLIEGINNYFNSEQVEEKVSETLMVQDTTWLEDCIKELRENSFDALELWEEKKSSLITILTQHEIDVISTCISDFNFEEALTMLEKVVKNEAK